MQCCAFLPALFIGPSGTLFGMGVVHPVNAGNLEWIATLLLTLLLIKATVTLLPFLNNLVTAEGTVVFFEAIGSPLLRNGIQHQRDVADRAGGELVIVEPVSAGSR